MAIVECVNVSRHFKQAEFVVKALDNLSIEIAEGEFVALCGPSGSGKTTLLNVISGLDRPTSGIVSVAGKRIDQMSDADLADFRLRELGFVFQAYNLIPVLSALENVSFVMELQGVSRSEREEKAYKILKEVGLEGMEHRRPNELSGGQQQRVAVARAIVSEPKIVLADEPTANLDSHTSQNLLEMMKEMNENHGVTFVFSTHDPLVMNIAKRLIRLKDGHLDSGD